MTPVLLKVVQRSCNTFVGGQTFQRPMILPPKFWRLENQENFPMDYRVKGDEIEERDIIRSSVSTGAIVSPSLSSSVEAFR
ncbi:hypothetical protein V6N11_059831 [Hibiscus sabdariffa]|uniref:Uncharacterized protein n=2 Tax=Hibiscus sabdariffa TaxID=183260 RepID=A0ABR2NY96_9ROSI